MFNAKLLFLENDEIQLDSEDWIKAIDRGGLIHISDATYMVFHSMEVVFRHNFMTTKETDTTLILQKLLEDNDLLFYWSQVSANWDEEADELLKLIANHWITIRGFSSVSAFMEKYKKANQKSVEKSKGLRKSLISK